MAGLPDMTECWRSRNRGRRERHEKGEALVGKTWLDPRASRPIVLLHGLCCGPGAAALAARTARETGSQDSGAIPFTLRDGYLIVVEGRIGAQRHLKLVLDTGATHSVLRPDLAREQMSLRRTVRIVNLDHVLTQELAEVPDFELGPIRIPLLPMMLNDLELSGESAPGVDGLIGLDVLRGRSFSIDFGRRKNYFRIHPDPAVQRDDGSE